MYTYVFLGFNFVLESRNKNNSRFLWEVSNMVMFVYLIHAVMGSTFRCVTQGLVFYVL